MGDVKTQNCSDCGKKLQLGDFAYEQITCWDCFVTKFFDIANKNESITSAQRELLYHLMSICAEAFGEKFKA